MTSNKKNLKRTGIITGTFLAVAVAGFASTSSNTTTSSNLLDFDVLGSGSEIRADVSTMNGNMYRTLELKCGEGKCGEGKCGEGEAKEKTKEATKEAKATSAKEKRKASKKAKKAKKNKGGE